LTHRDIVYVEQGVYKKEDILPNIFPEFNFNLIVCRPGGHKNCPKGNFISSKRYNNIISITWCPQKYSTNRHYLSARYTVWPRTTFHQNIYLYL